MPASRTTRAASTGSAPAKARRPPARKPASLPRSDGEEGVQAFIASMEPWQAALAARVDQFIVQNVPDVRKAIRWHCPFYGVQGQGWFLSFAAFQYHVKFMFFRGSALTPVPPAGQQKDARALDVREKDVFDEKQMLGWIRQAAAMPGWDGGSPGNGGVAL